MTVKTEKSWDWTISSKTSYWNKSFETLWLYRHFLISLVRKNFLLNYQQTILGPSWIIFQPLLTLVIYVVVFSKVVNVSTGTTPPVLFYFAGIVLWNFFGETFGETSKTFRANAEVFSKVYFPRIIIPISELITNFLRFLIQFSFLLLLIAYYLFIKRTGLPINACFFAFPVSVIVVGVIALEMGLIFSVLTAKYRDMINFASLIVRLLMFLTPVIYPLASVSNELRWVVLLNPLTPLFELFKLALLGEGIFAVSQFIYSLVFMFAILPAALLLFNTQGDKLIDVI